MLTGGNSEPLADKTLSKVEAEERELLPKCLSPERMSPAQSQGKNNVASLETNDKENPKGAVGRAARELSGDPALSWQQKDKDV